MTTSTDTWHNKTQHTTACTDDTCATYLEHFNERVIDGHPLAWSCSNDMTEELNALAVMGAEWDRCWPRN